MAPAGGVAVAPRQLELPPMMTVEELANNLSLGPAAVIQALIKNGIFATMNQVLDYDTAAVVAADLGFEVSERSTSGDGARSGDGVAAGELTEEELAAQGARPPVVTVMGHVDQDRKSVV